MNIWQTTARQALLITKSDTAPTYPTPIAGLYTGGAGDVKIVTYAAYEKALKDGVAFASMPTVTITCVAGGILPIQIYAIYSTGTTATNLVALYS